MAQDMLLQPDKIGSKKGQVERKRTAKTTTLKKHKSNLYDMYMADFIFASVTWTENSILCPEEF